MRIVDHVLVEHGIGVAKNESGQLFKVLLGFQVVFFKLLTRCREEHGINLCPILFVPHPHMLSIKSLRQHLTHLLIIAKKASKAAAATRTTATTVDWLNHLPSQLDELLSILYKFLDHIHILICLDDLWHESEAMDTLNAILLNLLGQSVSF